MCDNEEKPKVPLSDLILAAVCYLQEKNGVTACEIAEFIAKKRGCELDQIQGMIKIILCKATMEGILREKNGVYRIQGQFDDKPAKECDKVELCDEDSDSDSEDDDDGSDAADPCNCLKLSRECLSEEEENRCGQDVKCPKKRKCK